jgi:hypothetical protein
MDAEKTRRGPLQQRKESNETQAAHERQCCRHEVDFCKSNLLAAQDSDVLSTIREPKHLLHHRSHCRYHHRPQGASRVLATTADARPPVRNSSKM